MNARDLKDTLKKQPFQPFRIVVTDGAAYEIPHPDFLMVGRRTAVVGVPAKSGTDIPDHLIQVDVLHIIRAEPLEVASRPKKNGKR